MKVSRFRFQVSRFRFLALGLLFSVTATAQDSLLLRSYRHVQQADPWLTIGNAAALTRLSAPSIAEAELSATHQKGGFTDYYQSPSTVLSGFAAEALYRLSRRAVVFGRISYNNFSGKDMTGSAFINPTRKPFDLTEDSLTNAGDKHRDTYHLTGGLGVDPLHIPSQYGECQLQHLWQKREDIQDAHQLRRLLRHCAQRFCR